MYFSRVLFGDIPHAYFFSFELVVDGTADGKDNKKDKTSEVAEIRMLHFGWNFFPTSM